ncbi:hypothetical protein IQ268_02545 [Oculatella sp. LEGE 06141]|uniref:hypothetical protein n=1 Tax=Oculatella sp. LEGE 06141 TaxID=1828648 RepID=UPI001880B547|nr:hypothetical protein [Oculatella sp. LEGE 06141]MBE9177454.1 hypothetical protein [Oculatella sp. LEGE 06141]
MRPAVASNPCRLTVFAFDTCPSHAPQCADRSTSYFDQFQALAVFANWGELEASPEFRAILGRF